MLVRNAAARGHFKRQSGLYARHAVVARVPIAHNKAVIAPFVIENIAQKMLVFARIYAVYAVIRGHKSLCATLFHRDFKRGQVDFAQRALIDNGIHRHAVKLLRVDGKVLYAGVNALGLYPAYHRRRHLARQQRVFRKILEVSPGQGVAFDVHAGAEHHAYPFACGFLADVRPKLLQKRLVPRVCKARRRGVADCGSGLAQADIRARTRHFAQPVRPVTHHRRGYAARLHSLGVPKVRARHKSCLFFKRHMRDKKGIFKPFFHAFPSCRLIFCAYVRSFIIS